MATLYQWRRVRLNAALVECVKHDRYAEARQLLDQGADPNTREGNLPSFWNHLLDFGRWDSGEPVIFTALFNAYETRNTRMLELLLERHADPNVRDSDGQSPLVYYDSMMLSPNWEIVRLLLKYKADPGGILGSAIAFKKLDILDEALARGANIEYVYPITVDDFGDRTRFVSDNYTPLFEAVRTMQPHIVEMLLKRGAKANIICTDYADGSKKSVTLRQLLEAHRAEDPSASIEILALFNRYGVVGTPERP